MEVISIALCAGFAGGTCGCGYWMFRRCSLHGSAASLDWPAPSAEEFKDVDRICQLILAVYETDLENPTYEDHLNIDDVICRVTYADSGGKCPPYLIYVDHAARDVVLAIRGLHLLKRADYAVLMNNRKGQQKFDGGYAHHGLLQVANFLLEKEVTTLARLILENPGYTLTLAGHSLGSGVAALMTIMLVNNLQKLGSITRDRIRCYAVAPSRCTSMNIAVRYADVIRSIVLQDDFLPRTTVPLQVIFGAALCLPCLMGYTCFIETFTSEDKKLQDQRRLYAPGRLYHIVYTRIGSCRAYPASVKTAIPVRGRFEHIVCSCNATEDHSLVVLEKKVKEAYENLVKNEAEAALEPPSTMTMDRGEEHRQAMESAISLGVHNAETMFSGTEDYNNNDSDSEDEEERERNRNGSGLHGFFSSFWGHKKSPERMGQEGGDRGGERRGKEENKSMNAGKLPGDGGEISGQGEVTAPKPQVIDTEKPSIYGGNPDRVKNYNNNVKGMVEIEIELSNNKPRPGLMEIQDAFESPGKKHNKFKNEEKDDENKSKESDNKKEDNKPRKEDNKKTKKEDKRKGKQEKLSKRKMRQLAAQQRAREEEIVKQEQKKAEERRTEVLPLTRWELAINGLLQKHGRRGSLRGSQKKRKPSHWDKVRASLKPQTTLSQMGQAPSSPGRERKENTASSQGEEGEDKSPSSQQGEGKEKSSSSQGGEGKEKPLSSQGGQGEEKGNSPSTS